jgi:hypothetical protein
MGMPGGVILMRDLIIDATIEALQSVNNVRFFNTERGYQGRFYCALQSGLDDRGILNGDSIIEMEYQKSRNRHQTRQRPDIILHIPTEVSRAPVNVNNFSVWAIKRKASVKDAKDDFYKLDIMFEDLNYLLGFFINIDSNLHFCDHYEGVHDDRLVAFAVQLKENALDIRQASFIKGKMTENIVSA